MLIVYGAKVWNVIPVNVTSSNHVLRNLYKVPWLLILYGNYLVTGYSNLCTVHFRFHIIFLYAVCVIYICVVYNNHDITMITVLYFSMHNMPHLIINLIECDKWFWIKYGRLITSSCGVSLRFILYPAFSENCSLSC